MGIYVQHIIFEMCDILVHGDICPAYYIWNVWHIGPWRYCPYYIWNVWHIGSWGHMSSILHSKCVTYWFMGIYVQHIIFEMCDILVHGDICPAYYIWNVWHIGLWGYMSSILYLKCVTYWFMGIYVQHIIFEMCDILVYGDICPAYYIWNVWHIGLWGYMSSILYLKCVTYWFMGIYVQHIIFEMCDILVYGDICPAYYNWNVWHIGPWRYMSSILYLKCVTYWLCPWNGMCDILVYGDICPAYYIWNVWHIGLWGYMSSILYLKCVTLVYGDICPAYYIWNVWHIGLWGYMSSILYLKCVTYWFMGIYVQHIIFEMCDILVYGDIWGSSILYLKCVTYGDICPAYGTYWSMEIYVQHIIFEMCDLLVYGDICPAYYIWNVWHIGLWGHMSSILHSKCVTYWFMGIYVQHIIFEMCDILVYGDICPAYYIWNVWHIGLWGYMSSILYLKLVHGDDMSIFVWHIILYLKCVTYWFMGIYVQHIIFEMCDILVYGDICPAYYIWNVWHIGLWDICPAYYIWNCDILVYGDICPAYYIWNVWHIGLWGYMSSILYLKCVTYWFMGIYVQHIIFEMCDILVYGDICPAYYIWNVWHIGLHMLLYSKCLWGGYMSSILYLKCVTYWFMGIYVQHIIFEMCDILVYGDICPAYYIWNVWHINLWGFVHGDICPAYYIWNVWHIGLWGYMSSILYLKCVTYWFMGIYVQHIIFEMCDIFNGLWGYMSSILYLNVWHIVYGDDILHSKCVMVGGYMSSILYLKCVTYWFMGIYVQHIIFEMCDILVYGDICPAYYIWNVWHISLWDICPAYYIWNVWHIGLCYMSSILYLKCVTYWFMGIYVQHIIFEMCDILVYGDICPAYYIWNVWHISLWGYMSSILYLKCVTYWFMGIYVQHIIFEMCDILVYGDICPAYYIWNVWHIGLWGYMSSILYLKCVTY